MNSPAEKETRDEGASAASARPARKGSWIFNGLILGTVALLASWIIGKSLFPNPNYIEWLVVALMGICVLIAWLAYLRNDGIMKGHHQKTGRSNTSRIFLVGAVFLALASLILYFFFNMGRTL